MKKQQPVALYGGGNVVGLPLAQVRALAARLGPVKASSLRVASRIVNSLRAGHPVAGYHEFAACALILIGVPDTQAPQAIASLKAAPMSWKGKTVVLCSDDLSAAELSPLADLGADVASLASVPGFDGRWLMLEAEKAISSEVRSLFAQRGIRITLIERDCKRRYLDALNCTGAVFRPFVRKAAHSLKAAGVSSSEAEQIIERQSTLTIRSFYRSGNH